jgi:hypothetical protein
VTLFPLASKSTGIAPDIEDDVVDGFKMRAYVTVGMPLGVTRRWLLLAPVLPLLFGLPPPPGAAPAPPPGAAGPDGEADAAGTGPLPTSPAATCDTLFSGDPLSIQLFYFVFATDFVLDKNIALRKF